MATKKVAVICGAGLATSTMIREKLTKVFKDNQIDAKIVTGLALEADTLSQGADLIVATSQLPKDYGIPILRGIPFITGIGEEELVQKIIEKLKS